METTLLHIAADENDRLKCIELISSGIDVNSCDVTGATPLVCACRKGHKEIVHELLLLLSTQNHNNSNNSNNAVAEIDLIAAFHQALLYGHDEVAAMLLIVDRNRHHHRVTKRKRQSSLVTEKDLFSRMTSLHYAAFGGFIKCCKLLLEEIGDGNKEEQRKLIEETDCNGDFPIHLASENGNDEVLQYLLNHLTQCIKETSVKEDVLNVLESILYEVVGELTLADGISVSDLEEGFQLENVPLSLVQQKIKRRPSAKSRAITKKHQKCIDVLQKWSMELCNFISTHRGLQKCHNEKFLSSYDGIVDHEDDISNINSNYDDDGDDDEDDDESKSLFLPFGLKEYQRILGPDIPWSITLHHANNNYDNGSDSDDDDDVYNYYDTPTSMTINAFDNNNNNNNNGNENFNFKRSVTAFLHLVMIISALYICNNLTFR